MTPQVVKAARIVLLNPDNQAARDHFDMLKKQWMDQMETLRGLVDEAIDTAAFIRATGPNSHHVEFIFIYKISSSVIG